jgi:radical SAM superfamily enzyme YgiQ (UPF0313 family)
VVNKPITDEKISYAVEKSFDSGFNVKLYFLVGLPSEEMVDVEDMIDLVKRFKTWAPHPSSLRVSVNPFIPKPHTPFQWFTYDFKDLKDKIAYINNELSFKHLKTASPRSGLIQYVLSMGGPELGPYLERSVHKKIRFQEWLLLKPLLDPASSLPWKNINVGIKDEILLEEYQKALRGDITPWCETFGCYDCGACP